MLNAHVVVEVPVPKSSAAEEAPSAVAVASEVEACVRQVLYTDVVIGWPAGGETLES